MTENSKIHENYNFDDIYFNIILWKLKKKNKSLRLENVILHTQLNFGIVTNHCFQI